jgi:hypothetical protein
VNWSKQIISDFYIRLQSCRERQLCHVCPPHLGCHWTGFHTILYLGEAVNKMYQWNSFVNIVVTNVIVLVVGVVVTFVTTVLMVTMVTYVPVVTFGTMVTKATSVHCVV